METSQQCPGGNSVVLKPAVGPLRAVCECVRAHARAPEGEVRWDYAQGQPE